MSHTVQLHKYAVAYLRVSTDDQTVENQRIVLQKYAEVHGYTLLHCFEDPAISGKVPAIQRKGFSEMIDFIRTERIDAVYVYELSRVGRTFWETLEAIKLIENFSPLISCSPREGFLQNTDPSIRRLLIGILTWVAEREREMLIQRTKDGMERAKIHGARIGRPRKKIPAEAITRLALLKISKNRMAKELGVSKATLYKRLNDMQRVKATYKASDHSS